MKVLVTGASGFVGRHVVNELIQIPELEIIVTGSNLEKLQKCYSSSNITIVPYDIFDQQESSVDLMKLFQYPDKLIHLAWKGLPNYGSDFHITQNLPKDFSFLSTLIVQGLKDITIAGTCFEYGMKEGMLAEEMSSEPSNYYALAKDTLRRMLEIKQKNSPFDLKWTRLFYTYGEGQNPNSILPQLDKAIAQNELEFNMSGGEQVRDYLPIEQVASYMVQIAMQNHTLGIINICSGIPQKLINFVSDYLKQKNSTIKLNLGYYPYSPFEPMSFWGSVEKLNRIR
jgi:dTDP-6-deoxy-L-talose 4-dehydrogenase (NAD+)